MSALLFVPSSHITKWWPIVRPWIVKALKRATEAEPYTLEDVRQGLLDQHMQLWIMYADDRPRACAVSELIDDPEIGRIAGLPIIGGARMADWLDCLDLFEEWARECGAAVLQGQGRRGWARVLKHHGWDELNRRDDGAYEIRKRLH